MDGGPAAAATGVETLPEDCVLEVSRHLSLSARSLSALRGCCRALRDCGLATPTVRAWSDLRRLRGAFKGLLGTAPRVLRPPRRRYCLGRGRRLHREDDPLPLWS